MPSPTEPWPDGNSILEHISTHWHVVGDPLQFVMRYAPAVHRYLGALLKNSHDAEDAVQEFLMQTVRSPFTPERIKRGRFRDYLKAVLRNAAKTRFRRGAKQASLAADCNDFADDVDDAADREWIAEWRGSLLRRAWQALEQYENAASEGIAYTALRLAADFPQESSAALAAHASALTGRSVGVDAYRKQLSRARRRFAQLIVDEVRQTLENGSAEDVMDELCDLGLMEYVRDFLPKQFRSATDKGP